MFKLVEIVKFLGNLEWCNEGLGRSLSIKKVKNSCKSFPSKTSCKNKIYPVLRERWRKDGFRFSVYILRLQQTNTNGSFSIASAIYTVSMLQQFNVCCFLMGPSLWPL